MRSRPLLRTQALVLALLTGALASGLPSHHHDDEHAPVLANADHHGHSVLVVEQAERLKATTVGVALPSAVELRVFFGAALAAAHPAEPPEAVARGRPPPTDLPRAPPVSV